MSIYNLKIPNELIAQKPAQRRENARLLEINLSSEQIFHHKSFSKINKFVKKGDLLVLNDTKVINARFFTEKFTGGKVEVLLLEPIKNNVWKAMLGGKNIREGQELMYEGAMVPLKVLKNLERSIFIIEFLESLDVYKFLKMNALIPLPPYIKREPVAQDYIRYQTVFAKNEGSVASPTASLHFTKTILNKLIKSGVDTEYITLHVGYGTFSTVKDISTHKMHEERYLASVSLLDKIKSTKISGGRVWAVGTTVVRTLETIFSRNLSLSGTTNILIKPPYEFKVVDAMITNFHLPSTTLIYLVNAFAGEHIVEKAYLEAISAKYRFLSYGDAMILHKA